MGGGVLPAEILRPDRVGTQDDNQSAVILNAVKDLDGQGLWHAGILRPDKAETKEDIPCAVILNAVKDLGGRGCLLGRDPSPRQGRDSG